MSARTILQNNRSVTRTVVLSMLPLFLYACVKEVRRAAPAPVIVMETRDGYISKGEVREYPQLSLQIQSELNGLPWSVCIRPDDGFEMVHGQLSANEHSVFTLDQESFTRCGDHRLTITISREDEVGLIIRREARYTVLDSERQRPQCTLTLDGRQVSTEETFTLEVGTHECRFVSDIKGGATLSCRTDAPEGALSCRMEEVEASLVGTLAAQTPVSASVTFTVATKEGSWDYIYSLQVKDNAIPVELAFHPVQGMVVFPDVLTLTGEVKGLIQEKNTVEFLFDNKPIEPVSLHDGSFLLEVPSSGTSAGEHSVKGRVLSVATGNVLSESSCSFIVCGFNPRLYEKSSGQENWNRNARIGQGLTHVLDIELGTDADLKANMVNTANNQTVTGYQTSDRSHVYFQLTDREIARGPQELSIKLLKGEEVVAERTVGIAGWHIYTCRYSISNNAVFASLSGPTGSFAFPVHFSVSIYLKGVIPYTEAIEIGGRHYDKECYEYVDIESMGITFDQAKNETFSNKEIYSSSYFKYAGRYLSGELGKIHPGHSSTRWAENGGTWTTETYWPTPYLQANIILSARRTDGLPLEDYFEISYDHDSVRQWLSQNGVRMVTYLAN